MNHHPADETINSVIIISISVVCGRQQQQQRLLMEINKSPLFHLHRTALYVGHDWVVLLLVGW